MISDDCGLADHNAGFMIDEKALSDLRTRMDIDPGR
jgi:hypothetical protein